MGLKATSVRLDDEILVKIGQMADAMDKSRAWLMAEAIKQYVNSAHKSKQHDTKAHAKSWAAQTEFELEQMVDGVSNTHMLFDVLKRYAEEFPKQKKGVVGNCALENVLAICNFKCEPTLSVGNLIRAGRSNALIGRFIKCC